MNWLRRILLASSNTKQVRDEGLEFRGGTRSAVHAPISLQEIARHVVELKQLV